MNTYRDELIVNAMTILNRAGSLARIGDSAALHDDLNTPSSTLAQ